MPTAKTAATTVAIGDQLFKSKESETSFPVCGAKGWIRKTGIATIANAAKTTVINPDHAINLLFIFIFLFNNRHLIDQNLVLANDGVLFGQTAIRKGPCDQSTPSYGTPSIFAAPTSFTTRTLTAAISITIPPKITTFSGSLPKILP